MPSYLIRLITWIVLLLVPTVSFAAPLFGVNPDDKSMQYLGYVFGQVGNLPINPGEGNPLFQVVSLLLSQIFFGLAIVIIIYTAIVATISTAQEGEVMGKKWSTIWVPLRAGIGLYLLLPSAKGYSWIQLTVMWFIVQGVGVANALWEQVLVSYEREGSIHKDTREFDLKHSSSTVTGIFRSNLCMQTINSNPSAVAKLNGEFIEMYRYGDEIQFGRPTMMGAEAPICGSASIPGTSRASMFNPPDQNLPSDERRKTSISDAIQNAQATLEAPASEALAVPREQWRLSNFFVDAGRTLQSSIRSLQTERKAFSEITKSAIVDGWIHAGSYHFHLTGKGKGIQPPPLQISTTSFEQNQINSLLGQDLGGEIGLKINEKFSQYVNYVFDDVDTLSPQQRSGGILIVGSKQGSAGVAQEILDALSANVFDKIGVTFSNFINIFNSQNDQNPDPIVSMSMLGGKIIEVVDTAMVVSIIAAAGIMLATSFCSGFVPVGHMGIGVIQLLVPFVVIILGVCWMGAIMLALYIPLIPYMVFTFAAVTWLLLVIEAMIAAPMIALTLIVPSEDEIGKAGHAFVILFGIFLRPMLMIVGLVFAIKLLIVVIGMLNFGFASTATYSLPALGMFAPVAVFMIYVGIATSFVHEAFSLIYRIPDHVLRWMGAMSDAEGGEKERVKGLEQSADKGAGIGAGISKGAITKGASALTRK